MDIYNHIKTKPIVIIGQGPSVQCLSENIKFFEWCDVLWGSLNRFHVAEEEILSKINAHIDVVWFSALLRYEEMHTHIKHAGKRGSLIMTKAVIAEYFNFPANIYVSDFGAGFSSLFAMLCALIKLGSQNIYLIGFDGHVVDPSKVYYGQDKMHSDNYNTRIQSITRDTKMMNIFFWEYIEYALNVERDSLNIINLSGSALECFPCAPISTIIKRLEEGICSPLVTLINKDQKVEVRTVKFFISPQFGNVDVGQILKLTSHQVKIFVSNGLVEIVQQSTEPEQPTVQVLRTIHKRKPRKVVKKKTVDSYYTMEHAELLKRLEKIF